jgi:ceramide glucosyltransferase
MPMSTYLIYRIAAAAALVSAAVVSGDAGAAAVASAAAAAVPGTTVVLPVYAVAAAHVAATVAGTALILLTTLYAFAALLCRGRFFKPEPQRGGRPAPVAVTVLKPLCGPEPRLEHNLATFCRQTHPQYQLVFGVRDPDDPAIAIVQRLMRRFPRVDMQLTVDSRLHGCNRKVGNLANMMAAARHPWLVLADSDISVGPDYLERVTAPLHDPGVGIVTCLYHGRAQGGFWPRIGTLFIDAWFAPSVRVASSGGGSAFGFGATIALRAATLRAVGGFDALKDRLADDYWLGALTRRLGLRTVLSEVRVCTDVTEGSLGALWSRERRWLQTIRSLHPAGYACSCITFTLPMLALGLWLAPTAGNGALAVAGTGARLAIYMRRPAPGIPAPGHAAWAPLRDCLLLLEWLSAFAGSTTRWRRHLLPLHAPGMTPARSAPATPDTPS